MSIVILKSELQRQGGLEKMTLRIARAFSERGHPVEILTTGETQALSLPSSIQITSHRLSAPLSFLRVKEYEAFCTRELKKMEPKIVFGLDRNAFQTHLRAGNGVHAAYLEHRRRQEGLLKGVSFALNPLHRTLLKIEKRSFESPDLKLLITNSHMVEKEILRFYQTDPKKIQVIHNGVEWKEMQTHFDQWESQREEKLKNLNSFQLLFVGHNWKRKGLDLLMRGLSLLPQYDFHLSVIGNEKNSGYFYRLAKELNLEKKISFLGRVSPTPFYQLADALVIPSLYDPFANVTVEALAMGVFVISSKTNGGHEVLTKDNGTVIEDLNDPTSIASAIENALKFPKTRERAQQIRNSVSHLDFSHQLARLTSLCLP